MKINNWKKDKLFVSIIFFISFLIIFWFYYYGQNCCFWGDDYYYSQLNPNEEILYTLDFRSEHGAGYIGFFLSKFLSFWLPIQLNIHPIDFIGNVHSIIKGLFAVVTILLLTKFSTFFCKSKVLYISSFILISSFVFYSILNTTALILSISYSYYRYFFSFIFFSIFWYYIYKNLLLKNNKINYKELIFVSICAFILGTSSELAFFSSIAMIFLVVMHNIFCKITNKNHLKFNINKKVCIPFILLIFAVLLFTLSNGFRATASERGITSLIDNLSLFREFINIIVKVYILDIYKIWILFILSFLISLYFAIKKGKFKEVILPLLMQVSTFLVLFSLLFCGKTYLGNFFLSHYNIKLYIRIMFLIPSLILLGYVFYNINRNIRNKIIIIFSTIIFIYSFISFNSIPKEEIDFFQEVRMKEMKKIQYITEKIARFYHLNKEIPYIPKEYTKHFPFWFNLDENIECMYDFTIFTTYFMKIYKEDFLINFGYCRSDDALERFYEKGGTFTEEELKELKFERLKNRDFVLNKKEAI